MIRRLRQGLSMLWRGGRLDDEVRRELDFHILRETERHVTNGQSPEDARRRAMRDFGGVARTREEVRDARGMTFWGSLVRDVRFGVRMLLRSPGYATAAIGILALGIGANTAIFSVIDGVLLKPLPFADGDRLVLVQQSAPASNVANTGISIPELAEYRQRLNTVKDLVEYHQMSFILLGQGEPDRVNTGVVSANFFDVLGVAPLLGRTLRPADDELGADAVLVLSHAYWQEKFGGDRSVIGRQLEMNDRVHTVVGVLPDFPQYQAANDVYMSTSACPFRASAQKTLPRGNRSFASLQVFGHLNHGASEQQASTEIAATAARLSQEFANDYTRAKGFTGGVKTLQDQLVTGARPMLLALSGTTVLVLLIACANVANLTLARTMRRRRELALRAVLGASRARLLGQLLTESVILSIAGGALGLALAWISLDVFVSFASRFTARTGQISINGTVLLFTLAVSIVTGIVSGVAPALASRTNLAQAARDGAAQAGEGAGRQRLRAVLVVAQVAVSFVLLVGATLLLESVQRLSSVPLGYRTDRVMTASVVGNFTRQQSSADVLRDGAALLDRLRAIPSVRAAALTASVPLSAIVPGHQTIHIEGRDDDQATIDVDPNVASDQYFAALDVPIVAGRDFRLSDTADAPPVVIINATMARYWKNVNPVGSRFRIDGNDAFYTIVGVSGDFNLYGADQAVGPEYYAPFLQSKGAGGGRVVVAGDGAPAELIKTIRAAVYAVDPRAAVADLATIEQLKNGRLTTPRLTAVLLAIFAGVALVMTLAGITGVIATSVSQRTREFGLRMALGASRPSVLGLVIGQAVILVSIGLVVGVGGAYLFGRSLSQFLFATPPTDAAAYASVAGLFVLAGVIAGFAPARRATTINPLKALRSE